MSSSRGYASRKDVLNVEYVVVGSQYEHILLWRKHHGTTLSGDDFIIHHKDHDKQNNTVCSDDSGLCPVWDCGNLGAMTRADHIREHKPGRMGGSKIPNKKKREVKAYRCEDCGMEKSRNGSRCKRCASRPRMAQK